MMSKQTQETKNKTRRWLRLYRLLCLRQHVKKANTKNIVLKRQKSAFWDIFNPIVTLTFDLLTPKMEAFILVPKFISGESLVKVCQQIRKISW